MTRSRLKAIVTLVIAVGLLVWGTAYRSHRVITKAGKVVEIADPIVVQATCVGAIHKDEYGMLTGDPAAWGDTAGKDCPT